MNLLLPYHKIYAASYTGSLRKNATLLHHYNLGLKLINCLISLTYVAELRQILIIQFDLNYCKRLNNCIKALINQNIQSPLLSTLFKIMVRGT